MYELAGVVGIDPASLTLRELLAMHKGKCRDAWGRAALVACMIANVNRDPKKQRRPFTPDQFNPYADGPKKRGGMPITKATISMLKVLL